MALVSSAMPAVQQWYPSPAEQDLPLRLGHTGIHVWGWHGTTPPRKKRRLDVLYACRSESPQRELVSGPQTWDQTCDPTPALAPWAALLPAVILLLSPFLGILQLPASLCFYTPRHFALSQLCLSFES